MEMGTLEIRREMQAAFATGLRQKYGEVMGGLLGAVAAYGLHGKIDLMQLRRTLDNDAASVVGGIVGNRTDAPMMLLLHNQMIGCALIEDREAVKRWATEGLNRCQRIGGPWAATAPQWEWARDHAEQFILYARQLKYFLNQL